MFHAEVVVPALYVRFAVLAVTTLVWLAFFIAFYRSMRDYSPSGAVLSALSAVMSTLMFFLLGLGVSCALWWASTGTSLL